MPEIIIGSIQSSLALKHRSRRAVGSLHVVHGGGTVIPEPRKPVATVTGIFVFISCAVESAAAVSVRDANVNFLIALTPVLVFIDRDPKLLFSNGFKLSRRINLSDSASKCFRGGTCHWVNAFPAVEHTETTSLVHGLDV